ncbi:TonB-dependent receptor [Porphyromonas pogonae]|uniref:TonB-dependent receptor n=1 Tax=Porphyromonas pogonae TaxID=867595 RepID=UPI002E75AC2D|nr:TonB-dependent receptor [Porphyromonas pogonae]
MGIRLYAQSSFTLDYQITTHCCMQTQTVHQWLKDIEKEGFILSYNPKEISLNRKVTINEDKISVNNLLKAILPGVYYNWSLKSNKIIITYNPPIYTLSGSIYESSSHESLIGASVSIDQSFSGDVSNKYGYYCVNLSHGEHIVKVNYVGYQPLVFKINITGDTKKDFYLFEKTYVLKPLNVMRNNVNIEEKINMNAQTSSVSSSFLGVNDIMKQLQFISGVDGSLTSFTGLQVRGGSPDQNLVLFDEVPVYNYNHFSGIISIFNPDILKNVDFYKGLFPARYEGGLSSVVDIMMREGNMTKFHGGCSIDLVNAGLFCEGPIVKNKSSFIFSGRRSLINYLSRFWDKEDSSNASLYDLNFKANYKISDKDHIYLSGYTGRDNLRDLSFDVPENYKESLWWSNSLLSFRWNHFFSDKLFGNTNISYSKFYNRFLKQIVLEKDRVEELEDLKYSIQEYLLHSSLQYFGKHYKIKMGVRFSQKHFSYPSFSISSLYSDPKNWKRSSLLSLYFENKIKYSEKFSLNIGLNYNLYIIGSDVINNLQPRLQLIYQPVDGTLIYAGFSEMGQFYHQLSVQKISVPYELRIPSSNKFNPSSSQLYEVGIKQSLRGGKEEFKATLFMNEQNDILRYRFYQDILGNRIALDLQRKITTGQKNGQGLEMSYTGMYDRLKFNVSYTWNIFKEKFDGINNDKYYSSDFQRHTLKGGIYYNLAKNHGVTLHFAASSGGYITIPDYKIKDIDEIMGIERNFDADGTFLISHINNYKLPNNYQLNIGYVFHKQMSDKKAHLLKLGLNNILGREKPFSKSVKESKGEIWVKEARLPQCFPYISYSFQF